MRYKSFSWSGSLAVLLLTSSLSLAQPHVDSVFVFDDIRGYFSCAESLPNGDFLLGVNTNGMTDTWSIIRVNAQREIVWRRDFASIDFLISVRSIAVDGDRFFSSFMELVQIDTNTAVFRDVVVAYSMDGDSLWSANFNDGITNSFLKCIAPDGHGGCVVAGYEVVRSGETWNQEVRLTRLDSTGARLWTRYFGGEMGDEPGAVMKLDGDTVLVGMIYDIGIEDRVALLWVGLDGDSLNGRQYATVRDFYGYQGARLFRRGDRIDFVWPHAGQGNGFETLYWLATSYDGEVISEYQIPGPVDAIKGVWIAPDGLLTAGYGPWNQQHREAIVGRINNNGIAYYSVPLGLPGIAEAYGYLPSVDGPLTAFGIKYNEENQGGASFFYLSSNLHESFLFATPSQVNFGVVPQHEVAVREVALVVSADSSVTITAITMPEFTAVSLQPPVTIAAGESLRLEIGFRPDALQTYSDTIHIFSDAINPDLPIRVAGQAPFPVCAPSYHLMNFNWIEIGDSSQRLLGVRNMGTIPLHLAQVNAAPPFYIESAGPHEVAPDSFQAYWITFRPNSEGIYRDTLLFMSDDPQGPDTVVLAGRGVIGQVDADDPVQLPREFRLHAAYPNPFNTTAVIRFEVPRTQFVKLKLFDITGRLVKEILQQTFDAGVHQIVIDGAGLASGIYFAAIRAGDDYAVQKLLLVK